MRGGGRSYFLRPRTQRGNANPSVVGTLATTFGALTQSHTGLYTGVAGAADPSALPAASGQVPGAGTYGRSLTAGQTYVDPVSSVTVLKVTHTNYPDAGNHYTQYPTGGPHCSQAWVGGDGHTYYTICIAGGWLIDIRYDLIGVSNPLSNARQLPDGGGETDHAWSCNPATPRIIYITDGNRTVNRYDTQAMAYANTGNWPWIVSGAVAGGSIAWLQTQLNDTWLAAMFNSNQTMLAFRPSDGLQRNCTNARAGTGVDELHLDLTLPIVYISNNTGEDNQPWNLDTDTVTSAAAWNPLCTDGSHMSDDHATPIRGGMAGTAYDGTPYGGAYYYDAQAGQAIRFQQGQAEWHGNNEFYDTGYGNLFGHQGAITDQWIIGDNSYESGTGFAIRRGVIGIAPLNGGATRFLCASDNNWTSGYNNMVRPQQSPDGKLCFFTSSMNTGSTSYQVFVAKLPTT